MLQVDSLRDWLIAQGSSGHIHPRTSGSLMIGLMIVILLAWTAVSAVAAVLWGAVLRGGLEEDRARGYSTDVF